MSRTKPNPKINSAIRTSATIKLSGSAFVVTSGVK